MPPANKNTKKNTSARRVVIKWGTRYHSTSSDASCSSRAACARTLARPGKQPRQKFPGTHYPHSFRHDLPRFSGGKRHATFKTQGLSVRRKVMRLVVRSAVIVFLIG